jgi:uncharacterized membrane protein
MKTSLRAYFVTGLLVLIPIVVTIWVAQTILVWLDTAVPLEVIIGRDIPGLGILLSIGIILFAGILGQNFIGNWMMEQLAFLVGKIPFIGSVYGSLRQVMLTFSSTKGGDKFGRAVLVEFPKAGSWTVGFVTNDQPHAEISSQFNEALISVFVPTTPNPTSGFFMYVPKQSVKPLNMSVDDAFKIIVSLGLIGPSGEIRAVKTGEPG